MKHAEYIRRHIAMVLNIPWRCVRVRACMSRKGATCPWCVQYTWNGRRWMRNRGYASTRRMALEQFFQGILK